MVRWLVLALLIPLAAGCLGQSTADHEDVASTPDGSLDSNATAGGRLSRQGADEPGESYDLVQSGVPANLSEITELHWAIKGPVEAFVFEVRLDFGDENECEMLRGTATQTSEPGPVALSIQEAESSQGWGLSSRGGGLGYANAHAGPVDTRTLLGGEGSSASLHGSSGTFSGPMRFTLIGRDLHGWDNSFMGEEYSAALSIACDEPFAVLEARRGQTALMADANNLSGGAGADVFIAGSANVQDQASIDIQSPLVRAAAAGFGAHGGQVVLDHPGGRETWTVLPDYAVALADRGFFIDTAPGPHTFSVDHAGAYFEALWVAAWGLDGPFDLRAELLTESVIDSPF